jgi:hypothetical protein
VVSSGFTPAWRDNVAAKERWLATHPGWKHHVSELPRGYEHVMTAPDGTEYRNEDLGKLLDELKRFG